MSAAEAQAEPTMEEILASIRKIISEDDVAPSNEAMPDANVDDFGDDVLELSAAEPIEETPEPVVDDFEFDEPSPEPEPEAEPVFEEHDEIIVMDREPEPEALFEEPAPEPEPVYFEPEPIPMPEPVAYAPPPSLEPKPLEATIGLIGAQTAEATAAAFSRVGPALPGHFASGASVEELVSFLLKPMLKEWLDQHLPRIVEERVEAELARIARRGF